MQGEGLTERAESGAPAATRPGEAEQVLLVFRSASCWFAVDPDLAQEIAAPQTPTPVPRVPAYIPGLMKLRSRAVPLLDLQRFLDLPFAAASPATDDDDFRKRVVVVSAQGMTVGLLCDRVRSLHTVPAESLVPPTSLPAGRVRDFAKAELADPSGAITGRPGVVVVLDVGALLAAARVRAAETAP